MGDWFLPLPDHADQQMHADLHASIDSSCGVRAHRGTAAASLNTSVQRCVLVGRRATRAGSGAITEEKPDAGTSASRGRAVGVRACARTRPSFTARTFDRVTRPHGIVRGAPMGHVDTVHA